jgi:hypothetical protein
VWSSLTLIGVALLLSAANSTPPAHQQTPVPPQTTTQQRPPTDAKTSGTPETANRSDNTSDHIQSEIAQFTFLLVIIGGLQAIAGFFQWYASHQSARAASTSAKAAELALNANRPYIWVKKIEGQKGPPNPDLPPEVTDIIASANCFIQNLGKGPAFIIEVRGTLKFTYPPLPMPASFSDCGRVHILQPVVTEAEPTNFFVPSRGGSLFVMSPCGSVDTSHVNDPNNRGRFVCYGVIRYRDVYGNRYESTFGYHRQWLTFGDPDKFQWLFVRGPDEYNRERELTVDS